MKQEITAQVVMLPTGKHSDDLDGKLLRYYETHGGFPVGHLRIGNEKCIKEVWESQYLYFTTDEPITEEWEGYAYKKDVKGKIFKHFYTENTWYNDARKIVASTDPTLGLPAIPTAWIRDEYVPSNGSINEVRLETTYDRTICKDVPTVTTLSHSDYCKGNHEVIYKLKLTPDNEVVIVEQPDFTHVESFNDLPSDVLDDIREKMLQPTKSVEQELEDAAGKSATETHPICMLTVDDTTFDTNHYKMIAHFHGFKAGVQWQKEQSAIDAIGFGKWIMRQKFGHLAGKSYKELYREYQKLKNNADN